MVSRPHRAHLQAGAGHKARLPADLRSVEVAVIAVNKQSEVLAAILRGQEVVTLRE